MLTKPIILLYPWSGFLLSVCLSWGVVHACVGGGQRSSWDISLHHSPCYFLKQSLSLILELIVTARPASPEDFPVPVSSLLGSQTHSSIPGFLYSVGCPNSGHTLL